jgi:hypothetical protein
LGVAGLGAGLETPTSAGFRDCSEHALHASNMPKIASPAIVASLGWRDRGESVVPEIGLEVLWAADLLSDFQVVVKLSPPLRLAQSLLIWQAGGQPGGD